MTLGVSPSSVSRRLNGKTPTTVDEAAQIARLLGSDLADLLERADVAA